MISFSFFLYFFIFVYCCFFFLLNVMTNNKIRRYQKRCLNAEAVIKNGVNPI